MLHQFHVLDFYSLIYVLGITDWDDFGLISQVLATSQEEYLENLRRQKDKDKNVEEVGET